MHMLKIINFEDPRYHQKEVLLGLSRKWYILVKTQATLVLPDIYALLPVLIIY